MLMSTNSFFRLLNNFRFEIQYKYDLHFVYYIFSFQQNNAFIQPPLSSEIQ